MYPSFSDWLLSHFAQEVALSPVPLASGSLNSVGKKPVEKVPYLHLPLGLNFTNIYLKAIVLSLPTIESSYVTHTTKGVQGFDHPEYPAFRVALEVLNATESYLWVCYSFS